MARAAASVTPRLATGDWVRLVGLDPSFRGVGKLVEGEYDEVTGVLRAACVDLGGAERWIAARELARVTPDEEAHLVEAARARGLLPAEGATAGRLRDALAAFRAGARPHVRTPGLLDLLWNLSTFADPDHGAPRISDLLLDAAGLLAPPAPPPPEDHDAPAPVVEVDLETGRRRRARREPSRAPVAVAPPVRLPPPARPPLAGPEQVLLLALQQLNRRARKRLAQGVDPAANGRLHHERDLVRAGVDLAAALDELTPAQLAVVHAAAGLEDGVGREPLGQRERLLALARHPAAPAPLVAALALERVLAVVGGVARASVARALQLEPAPAPALAARLLAAGASVDDVAAQLTLGELRFAAARLGLAEGSRQDEPALRGWLRSLGAPAAPP